MQLRKLNHDGLIKFREFIDSARTEDTDIPFDLLTSNTTSDPIKENVELSNTISVTTKMDMAKYLAQVMSGLDYQTINSKGLWSWLGLYFFDLICPKSTNGKRNVGATARYLFSKDLPDGNSFRRYYRHLLYVPFTIARFHKGSVGNSLLWPKVSVHGDMMEQIAARQEFIQNYNILEALDRLYITTNESGQNLLKPGSTEEEVDGSVRRFIAVLQQLDRTYDFFGMDSSDILSMLPDEFDGFKQSSISYRNFKEDIAGQISKSLDEKINPIHHGDSNTLWKTDDEKLKVVIRVSKYTEGEDNNYWFTCSQGDFDELGDAESSYYVLGLVDSLRFYTFDLDFFRKIIKELDPRPDYNIPTWDLRLKKDKKSGELFFNTKEGPISIEKYSQLPGKKKGFTSVARYRVAFKRFSSVEVDGDSSNQHEINGTSAIREVLGSEKLDRITVPVRSCRSDTDETTSTNITWYDARENNPDRTEWRLYYGKDLDALEDDLLVIIRDNDSSEVSLWLMVVAKDHYMENQIVSILPVADIGSGESESVETDINLFNLI